MSFDILSAIGGLVIGLSFNIIFFIMMSSSIKDNREKTAEMMENVRKFLEKEDDSTKVIDPDKNTPGEYVEEAKEAHFEENIPKEEKDEGSADN